MDEAQLSKVFAALGDPTRRDLVARLARRDATLTELASSYDVSVQAVAKHLKVLEDAGLVLRTKEAQRRPCHLDAQVLDLMTGWIERRRREVGGALPAARRPCSTRWPPTRTPTDPRRPRRRSSIMTSTTHHETEHRSPPRGCRSIEIVREFDAPPRAGLPRAHRPRAAEAVARPAPADHAASSTYDIVRGGSYRYVHIDEDGTEYGFWGAVHDVRPDELIAQTFGFDGAPDDASLDEGDVRGPRRRPHPPAGRLGRPRRRDARRDARAAAWTTA